MHLVVLIVDEAEGGDAAGLQAEVFLHSGLRGEGQLALVQALLEVVDVHLVHTLEDDQVMLVAFVVPEKQVLAVRGLKLAPVGQRLFNGTQRRMELDVEVDAEAEQGIHYFLLPLTQELVDFGWFHILVFYHKTCKTRQNFFAWLWKACQPAAFWRRRGCAAAHAK